MPVPPQRRMHRPILEIVGNAGDIVSLQYIRAALSEHFSLTEIDLSETVPSGSTTRFENRMRWAISKLRGAGLLHSPERSRFQITPEGREFLATHTGHITAGQLDELARDRKRQEQIRLEYLSAPTDDGISDESIRDGNRSSDTAGASHTNDSRRDDSTDVTPDEQIGTLYEELNNRLADELLESVREVTPDRFERLVVDLLEKMGYGEGESVGGSGDRGIDGIIDQDPLGLEKIYIQAKRWRNKVGEPEIRNFSGSLAARGASKGVFITTSSFSSTAKERAHFISSGNQIISLIDGRELARLMIRHNVGVITEITYEVKKLDENYFAEGS